MSGIKINISRISNHLSDANLTTEEQGEYYDLMLEDLYKNPRWYLDNYMYLTEVRVSWVDYKTANITKPYRFVKEELKFINKNKTLINETTPNYRG